MLMELDGALKRNFNPPNPIVVWMSLEGLDEFQFNFK